jgi:hypothetical protein
MRNKLSSAMGLCARRLWRVPRRKTSASVVVAVLAMALGGIALTASPALAVGHTCEPLGTYKGVEGVMCIDLVTVPGEYYAAAEAQAICESGGNEVQCAGATVFANAFNPATAADPEYGELLCGHQYVACGDPRTILDFINLSIPIPEGTCADNVWAVLEAGSSIQLPGAADDHVVSLGSNLGTPHFNLCEPVIDARR